MMGDKRRQHFISLASIPRCIAAIYICMLSCVGGSPGFELKEQLLASYAKHNRPVKNHTKPTTVFLDMALQQISDLDERNQILTTSIWMRWYWKDEHLVWNPSNHSGITSLHIPPSEVWTPDIAIYNNVKAEEADWPETYDVAVTSTGDATWKFPFISQTSCRIDISQFPYDIQVCYFKLGSWNHNGYEIDVQNVSEYGDITAFVDNGIWALQELTLTRNVGYYSCCPEPYPDITFAAKLQRRSLFYTLNLILPCILFSFINLFTFLLPVESGDKISLNVTILLALDVFLLIVAETMPPQSEVVPDIGIYFITCNGIICVSIVCSVFIIHLYYRGSRGHNAPRWVSRYIIFGLGPLLAYGKTLGAKHDCSCRYTKVVKCERDANGQPISTFKTLDDIRSIPLRQRATTNDNGTDRSMTSLKSTINDGYISEESEPSTQSRLSSDDSHKRQVYCKNNLIDPVLEWQHVSLVMDRFFFVILTLATVGLTLYILSRIRG